MDKQGQDRNLLKVDREDQVYNSYQDKDLIKADKVGLMGKET